jgi:hypothetical protein
MSDRFATNRKFNYTDELFKATFDEASKDYDNLVKELAK